MSANNKIIDPEKTKLLTLWADVGIGGLIRCKHLGISLAEVSLAAGVTRGSKSHLGTELSSCTGRTLRTGVEASHVAVSSQWAWVLAG